MALVVVLEWFPADFGAPDEDGVVEDGASAFGVAVELVQKEANAVARLVDLRALGATERKARARELALVIREVLDTPRPPPPVKAALLSPAAPKKRTRAAPEVSLFAGAEKYSAGYAQLGPSLGLRLTRLSRLVLELRVGARFAPQLRAAAGDVSAHGFIGSLGVGLNLLPTEASASLVLVGHR